MAKRNIPGPQCGYTDLLDLQLIKNQKETQAAYKEGTKKRYYPLRPSAAGYCARRLAMDLMQYYGYADYGEKINSPELERLFDLGNSVEYSVLRMFGSIKEFSTKYKQQTLDCFQTIEQIIEGSCDACFISDDWKCVVDVKSAKDGFSKVFKTRWDETLDKFNRMQSAQKISETAWYIEDINNFRSELGDDFLLDNIYQLNLYACSDFMKNRGVDHAVIYKYNKNDSRHYELRFKPSDDIANEIKNKFNLIIEAVKKKKIEDVPRTCKLGTMRAAFCPCRDGEDAKKEWFKTFPPKDWPVDLGRLEDADLTVTFMEYEALKEKVQKCSKTEERIIDLLAKHQVQKIKLDNGNIYEVKFLKSPKPHYELRQTKL